MTTYVSRRWAGPSATIAAILMTSVSMAAALPPALSPLEDLGRALFEDTSLSAPAGESCASCHAEAQAFTGNAGSHIAAVAAGSRGPDGGQFGSRNAPTAMYMSYSPPFSFVAEKNEAGETEWTPTGGQFWDGRADSLDAQARGPFLNPAEMGNADAAAVVAKVRVAYAAQFSAVFGADAFASTDQAMTEIVTAIAAYETSEIFHPFTSKFDDYLRGTAQLSPQEAAGFALFKDPQKGNCVACHAGNVDSHDPQDWLFTDFTYDNLGLPRNADIPANQDATHFDLGLCQRQGLADLLPRGVTLESLCGAFKVPTLRNVAVTAPYFHNGAFPTLKDAVSFYVTRDTSPERWFPKTANGIAKFNDLPVVDRGNVNTEEAPYDRKLGEAPRLTAEEIDDVVAFLNTLTDAAYAK